jgi:hypothetical protein
VEVRVNRISVDDWQPNYQRVEKYVAFQWQTDVNREGESRLWYAQQTTPSAKFMSTVEAINEFAKFMRKLIRRTEWENIESLPPAAVIEALEKMKVRQMVTDRRLGKEIFLSEVQNAEYPGWRLSEPDGEGYLIKTFIAETEHEAQDLALPFMAERARNSHGPDSRRARQLGLWVTAGMKLERTYDRAPDTRTANEIIDEGQKYVDYSGREIDHFGRVVEVDEEAVASMGAALDEEE